MSALIMLFVVLLMLMDCRAAKNAARNDGILSRAPKGHGDGHGDRDEQGDGDGQEDGKSSRTVPFL